MAREVAKASGSNGRVGALRSMDRAGNAANRPRTTVKPRDFGAICNAVRAGLCWLTPMRELRSGVRLGEAANEDRGIRVDVSDTPEPAGSVFSLDRLQDSVAYGWVPERICYRSAGFSPGRTVALFNHAARH